MTDDYLYRAIKSINENAEFRFEKQDIDTIEWLNGTTPIAKNVLEAKVQEIKDEK